MNKIRNIIFVRERRMNVPAPANHKGAEGISDGGQGGAQPLTTCNPLKRHTHAHTRTLGLLDCGNNLNYFMDSC